ncbi:MAG: alpha-L-fucosidase, partial [Bacteroidetes bacterium]|nr:alpha-L-fucosidase [Bacteroidota bacterium]
MKNLLPTLGFILLLASCQPDHQVSAPAPVMPVPSPAQLAWHELEFYGFVHFNMNTFSNMEGGMGDEDPSRFNPTELDCKQWAKVCKEAGLKGIILTAKHHDGFCLWPSAYTEHSVKNAPWKNGKGDVVKELSEACKEYGLKFGVYLSPWDRNHADYGKPEYITYFRNQLRELLTNYGDVFEVWFDGANGGTGYYGGANEERRVDKQTYYDWENTYKIIYELQPNAIIFSDAGPGCRWVGNEHGFAYPTTWSNLMMDSVYGGMIEYADQWSMGQENGTHWVPAEADVSIRPGWYYHEYEDHKVKSLPDLLEIYYKSVGRNASLLLNFPVDKRGLIHENDVVQLQKLTTKLKEDFANDLARRKEAKADSERGKEFATSNLTDGDTDTYWATFDSVIQASVTVDFGGEITFNRVVLQEYIALGQRIKQFTLEAKTDQGWKTIAEETTIGYKRILRLPETKASELRLNILDAKACPVISNLEVYLAPKLVIPPAISRNKAGEVSMNVPEEGVNIYYTSDETEPTPDGQAYSGPFLQKDPAIIQAIAVDQQTGKISEISRIEFDISAANWKVISSDEKAVNAIDGNSSSYWTAPSNPGEIVIDLGEQKDLRGFTYLPMQARWISGFIKEYEFWISRDNQTWTKAASGEFANILNSPILQRVAFDEQKARYIKLKAVNTVDGKPASFAE